MQLEFSPWALQDVTPKQKKTKRNLVGLYCQYSTSSLGTPAISPLSILFLGFGYDEYDKTVSLKGLYIKIIKIDNKTTSIALNDKK